MRQLIRERDMFTGAIFACFISVGITGVFRLAGEPLGVVPGIIVGVGVGLFFGRWWRNSAKPES
jgi:hypothetical protein